MKKTAKIIFPTTLLAFAASANAEQGRIAVSMSNILPSMLYCRGEDDLKENGGAVEF